MNFERGDERENLGVEKEGYIPIEDVPQDLNLSPDQILMQKEEGVEIDDDGLAFERKDSREDELPSAWEFDIKNGKYNKSLSEEQKENAISGDLPDLNTKEYSLHRSALGESEMKQKAATALKKELNVYRKESHKPKPKKPEHKTIRGVNEDGLEDAA